MSHNAKSIIEVLTKYLEANPELRFSQALFNLNINQFADQNDPGKKDFLLRDIYNDSDQTIINRIKSVE